MIYLHQYQKNRKPRIKSNKNAHRLYIETYSTERNESILKEMKDYSKFVD